MSCSVKKQFYYRKIVRDKIIDNLKRDNIFVEYTQLDDQTFSQELNRKLKEEADELASAKDKEEIIEEIADLQEIIDTLKKFHRINDLEIRDKKQEKLNKRGAFAKRYYVDYVEVPHNYWLFEYCSTRPQKYPLKEK